MIRISGYQVSELVHESRSSLIYRAQRAEDDRPVILKMLKDSYPSPETIAWFRREYETTSSLADLDGVVDVFDLHADQNRWLMSVEDFGGVSLNVLLRNGGISLDQCLVLAIELADALGRVHQRHIIHKDINPSNIVLNPQTEILKLIDFGISTVLPHESATLRDPSMLEGTLAYMSPEQTGRMNRTIDYRSDFYSLGATLYELLTGQLPFATKDPMELVHSHIARQPMTPHERTPAIPPLLSSIVMKLMAKNAEDRYQSAYGLKADLKECQRQWTHAKRIDSFTLAQRDFSDRFQIQQRLYGRTASRSSSSPRSSALATVPASSCWCRATPESANRRWSRKSTNRSPGDEATSSAASSISYKKTSHTIR